MQRDTFLKINSLFNSFVVFSNLYLLPFCASQGSYTPKWKQRLISLGFFPVDCLYSEIQVSVDQFQGLQISWKNSHKWVSLFFRNSICHFYQLLESTPRRSQYREKGGLWFLIIALATLHIFSWIDLELSSKWA